MAKNDDGFYHTLRLSRRNPNHIRMHQILVDLDKSVYKSQNQFIVDAVEFYINALEEDVITNSGKQKRQESIKILRIKGEGEDNKGKIHT